MHYYINWAFCNIPTFTKLFAREQHQHICRLLGLTKNHYTFCVRPLGRFLWVRMSAGLHKLSADFRISGIIRVSLKIPQIYYARVSKL